MVLVFKVYRTYNFERRTITDPRSCFCYKNIKEKNSSSVQLRKNYANLKYKYYVDNSLAVCVYLYRVSMLCR